MNRSSAGSSPYDLAHDEEVSIRPHLSRWRSSHLRSKPDATPKLKGALSDSDSGVRYWAVLGLIMRGADAVNAAHDELEKMLDDPSPDVRIASAEALGRFGTSADLAKVLPLLGQLADWSKNDVFTAMAALNAITALGEKAAPLAGTIATLPATGPAPDARFKEYIPRLIEELRSPSGR